MSSGPKRGTVMAIVPPGRSTRASSPIAERSSGRCSNNSEHITLDHVVVNGSLGELARFDHRDEHRGHPVHLVRAGVERDHTGATTSRFEGVATKATAEVEDLVAVLQTELLVLSGQHQSKIMESGSGRSFKMAS